MIIRDTVRYLDQNSNYHQGEIFTIAMVEKNYYGENIYMGNGKKNMYPCCRESKLELVEETTKGENMEIKAIYFNEIKGTTTVKFKDDSIVTVRAGDAKFDKHTGLVNAIAQKAIGSNSEIKRLVKNAHTIKKPLDLTEVLEKSKAKKIGAVPVAPDLRKGAINGQVLDIISRYDFDELQAQVDLIIESVQALQPPFERESCTDVFKDKP